MTDDGSIEVRGLGFSIAPDAVLGLLRDEPGASLRIQLDLSGLDLVVSEQVIAALVERFAPADDGAVPPSVSLSQGKVSVGLPRADATIGVDVSLSTLAVHVGDGELHLTGR
jgi:hypothetical protein